MKACIESIVDTFLRSDYFSSWQSEHIESGGYSRDHDKRDRFERVYDAMARTAQRTESISKICGKHSIRGSDTAGKSPSVALLNIHIGLSLPSCTTLTGWKHGMNRTAVLIRKWASHENQISSLSYGPSLRVDGVLDGRLSY